MLENIDKLFAIYLLRVLVSIIAWPKLSIFKVNLFLSSWFEKQKLILSCVYMKINMKNSEVEKVVVDNNLRLSNLSFKPFQVEK